MSLPGFRLHSIGSPSVRKYPTRDMLGRRKVDANSGKPGAYIWTSYEEVLDQVGAFGMGLSGLLSGHPKAMFGLCSKARPEWLIADLAAQGYGMVSVVLYENYSSQVVQHVLKETEIRVVICDLDSIGLFLTAVVPTLKGLICMDPVPDHLHVWAKEKGVELKGMKQVMALGSQRGGAAINSLIMPIPSHELLTVTYTPGTTDAPKGVMLSGSNFAAVLFSLLVSPSQKEGMRMEHLSYAEVHIRSRAYFGISQGHSLGFASGKDDGLMDDIRTLRPTILPLSPSLAANIRAEIEQRRSTANPLARRLFEKVVARKLKLSRFHGSAPDATDTSFLATAARRLAEQNVAQKLALMPYRALLGGRVVVLTYFGRPLLPGDVEFLRVVLGADVVQMYGVTETCGQGFTSRSAETGRVGGVVPLLQAKLVDCPELEYAVADQPLPRGEVWLRGPSLCMGYFNKLSYAPGAWYATGDIASLSPTHGEFSIIDRKANFFKLASGCYITPERVESAYKRLPLVADLYVPSEKGSLAAVAIVHPNPQEFLGWVAYHFQRPTSYADLKALCGDPEVQVAFCAAINRSVASLKALAPEELVRAVYLVPKPFAATPDLVTPGNQLKRNQLKRYFASQIAHLLQALPQPLEPQPSPEQDIGDVDPPVKSKL
ncbi:medium-chain fatty acid-CoA ligase faa2 [Massospora cicadina]|nr:medium-chain fatty acid-CoA ligase faa2 [Massospora cicadina]